MEERKPAVIVLADGTVFEGKALGKIGSTTGEIAFNTGMTGYQEVFTDPSYFGQILVMTTPHIGNYGVHNEDVESDRINISGLVTKKFSDIASRASASGTLEDFMILPVFSQCDFKCLKCKVHHSKNSKQCCSLNGGIMIEKATLSKLVIPDSSEVEKTIENIRNEFILLHFPDILDTILL